MSPGGGMESSLLNTPEPPPSSATVTIAVISEVNSFRPRSIVERPVPPPMHTTFGDEFMYFSILFFNIAVSALNRISQLGRVVSKLFSHSHRAVMSAGAANCNDKTALALFNILGKEEF